MPLINTKPPERKPRPFKGIIYGVHGGGKSTFGAQSDGCYFLDCENGLGTVFTPDGSLPAQSGYLERWDDIYGHLLAFEREDHGAKTLVVDTLDWLIRRAEESVSGDSITSTLGKAQGGYGNGKQVLKNYVFKLLLPCFDRMVAKGYNVLLLAHAAKSETMDGDGIKTEKLAPDIMPDLLGTMLEWSDFVGFASVDGGKRTLLTTSNGRAEAKNRYSMPETIPLDWRALKHYVNEAYKAKTNNPKKDTV
jgi:hypothetical protein